MENNTNAKAQYNITKTNTESGFGALFIRVKTKSGSLRKAVQFVESVRDGKKVRQRIVRHIGVAKTEVQLEKFKELGEIVEAEVQCEWQPPLIPQEDLVKQVIKSCSAYAKKGPPGLVLKRCSNLGVASGRIVRR